jgi:hypothetical protein
LRVAINSAWGSILRLNQNPNLLKQIGKDSSTRFSGFETDSLGIDSQECELIRKRYSHSHME